MDYIDLYMLNDIDNLNNLDYLSSLNNLNNKSQPIIKGINFELSLLIILAISCFGSFLYIIKFNNNNYKYTIISNNQIDEES